VAAQVSLAEFQHLRYLAGDWRGRTTNGSLFYERYVIANDSTLASYTINDSSFTTASDSGAIRWSNGQVRSGSDHSSYVATVWTADSVRFEPEAGARNAFVWVRESPDAWTARLYPLGSSNVTSYAMHRVR
jgi:hypothetical protein